MDASYLLALLFLALLIVDRRYGARALRLGIVALALVVLFLAQPGYINTARRVSVAPPGERITTLRGEPISDYLSGVTTLYEAIGVAGRRNAAERLLAIAVLAWLACSPLTRPDGSRRARSRGGTIPSATT